MLMCFLGIRKNQDKLSYKILKRRTQTKLYTIFKEKSPFYKYMFMLTYEYSPKFDDIKTVLILLCIDIALFYINSNYNKDIL